MSFFDFTSAPPRTRSSTTFGCAFLHALSSGVSSVTSLVIILDPCLIKKSTILAFPCQEAHPKAVCPSSLMTSISAPCSNSISKVLGSSFDPFEATCNNVFPRLSTSATLAPRSTSNSITCQFPNLQASRIGLLSQSSFLSGSAPATRSAVTTFRDALVWQAV